MKLRLAQPEHLIDINDLDELDYIALHPAPGPNEPDELRIGALTRHVTLLKSDLLNELFPIFREAEELIADPVVRNRGTIGGSLCQADPSEDLSAVCEALHADVVIRSQDGERIVNMADFHVGPYVTAVGAAEMVTEVRIKVRSGAGSAHEKLERRAGDFAVAASSVAVWIEGGTIADAGIALVAVGPFTIDAKRAREHLLGRQPADALFAQAAEIAAEEAMPAADGRGPVDYKRHLVGVLTRRALARASAHALGRPVGLDEEA